MKTHDFNDSNYGNNPLRAEQLRIASALDLDAIDVDVFGGPSGSNGFRSGRWTAKYAGRDYTFFASIPHGATLDQQRARLTLDAARHIAGVASGYVKESHGQ
jgi:hypothetical protein